MLMSLFASERKDGGGRRGAKRDMELMQRAIRTWSSGCHRAIHPLFSCGKEQEKVRSLLYLGPKQGKEQEIKCH